MQPQGERLPSPAPRGGWWLARSCCGTGLGALAREHSAVGTPVHLVDEAAHSHWPCKTLSSVQLRHGPRRHPLWVPSSHTWPRLHFMADEFSRVRSLLQRLLNLLCSLRLSSWSSVFRIVTSRGSLPSVLEESIAGMQPFSRPWKVSDLFFSQ